jgi:hypothetical protein
VRSLVSFFGSFAGFCGVAPVSFAQTEEQIVSVVREQTEIVEFPSY